MLELIVSGSYSRLNKPNEISNFIKNGIFIDQRNGMPMEMDAWGLCHALEFYNTVKGIDTKDEINALIATVNKKLGNSNFKHNHWHKEETHYRFVTYFIALLIKLIKQSYPINKEQFDDLLKRSIHWSEKTDFGTWFLHDSQELKVSKKYHDYHLRKKVIGENYNNMLILNTHINFIYTYLYYLNSNIKNTNTEMLDHIIDQAIHSFEYFFKIKDNFYFRFIDQPIRNFWFKNYRTENKLISKLLNFYFHRIRLKQKYGKPILFFSDGYTEREVKLAGTNAQYHLINLNDIAKLIVQLSIYDKDKYYAVINASKLILSKGLHFCATNRHYRNLLLTKLGSYCIEYCEALAISFQWETTNMEEMDLYYKIREKLPPTPLLKGFDDIAFPKETNKKYLETININNLNNIDTFPANSKDNKIIILDIENQCYSIKPI